MEPDPNIPKNTKSTECPLNRQINRYRTNLPEVERSQNHFFFKEINHEAQQIAYVTLGYRVGQIPFQLMDLFSVIVNEIHCYADANVKLIIDDDQLWVTSTLGFHVNQVDSLRYNVEEANISEALQKTQNLLKIFLDECKKSQNRTQDKKVLEKVRKQISKNISLIFKNPNIDD